MGGVLWEVDQLSPRIQDDAVARLAWILDMMDVGVRICPETCG